MYIFQTLIYNALCRCTEELHFIPVVSEYAYYKVKMNRQHIRNEYSMGCLHIISKNRIISQFVHSLNYSAAAIRLLSLIFAAPRLLISSILS